MKGLYFIGGLLIGAAGGVYVGIKLSEKKCADRINEELDKIHESYSESRVPKEENVQEVKEYNREEMINKPSVTEMAKSLHYIPEEDSHDEVDDFELISDTEFAEYDDFETITLYMENGVLKNYDEVNPAEIDPNLDTYIRGVKDVTDSDAIYIRDGSNMRDYEVIINDSPMEG